MSLFESYYNELAKTTVFESIMTAKYKKNTEKIRNLTSKIYELKNQLGKDVTADGVTAKMQFYDDVIQTFYGALGFHYASLEKYTKLGIVYDFSSELEYHQGSGFPYTENMREAFNQAFTCITHDEDTWDIEKDAYHANLLATDKNKNQLLKLFAEYLPNYRIYNITYRPNDYGSMSMRFTVQFTYTDIEALHKRICQA